MARSAPELDFFNMEKGNKRLSSSTNMPPIFERRRSFRDIQGVISKISPEVLKSVIENASVPSTPTEEITQTAVVPPILPVCDPTLRLSCGSEKNGGTAPMTIFYNGAVAFFDVSPFQAQDILKRAEEGVLKSTNSSASNSYEKQNLLENLNDLPIARRKSLQRFLEKRTGRSMMASPV